MAHNRAALPTPPAYARGLRGVLKEEAVRSLFAQLREMGVNCENCKWRDDPKSGNPEMLCETSWVSLVEEYDFLCNSWEGKSEG